MLFQKNESNFDNLRYVKVRNRVSKSLFILKTKLFFPRLHKLHKKAKEHLQYEDLKSYNFSERQRLISHSLKNCRFYQEKYKELVFLKQGLQSQEDFLKIPPLTREELRKNFKTIKSVKAKPWHYEKFKTSGSTSAPVTIFHDKRHPETPIRWRILDWWGIDPWENQAFIYRFKKPFLDRARKHLIWWPTQRVFLAAANLTQNKLDGFIKRFNKIKPALLQGYVDVVYEFALYILDNDISLHPPKMVWVTSAPLFEEHRRIMEKAFKAPVCDQYGNTEILLIAAESPNQNGLHIMQDTVYIEFVDKQNQPVPPNTMGKILLTDLTNYAFPLIRYEIGDEGKYLDRKDGSKINLDLMENVKGRQAYVIKTPSGLSIKGDHLLAMFNDYMKPIKAIQLIQNDDYSVIIKYIPRKTGGGKEEIQTMIGLLKSRTRNEIPINQESSLNLEQRNVKTPLIISKLA